MTNREMMDLLIARALKERILTPEQIALTEQIPGTFVGANGFVGRACKHCCGVDKPRGNIAIPIQEMHDLDTCKVCHEMQVQCGEG